MSTFDILGDGRLLWTTGVVTGRAQTLASALAMIGEVVRSGARGAGL